MAKKSKRTLRLIRFQREVECCVEKDGRYVLSDYAEARVSHIHGRGVFATERIPRGMRIIEYVGEKISKTEAVRRSNIGHAVYIFDLNARVDIDGAVGGNGAHLMNHSCEPNAESEWDDNHVYIVARRSIKPGEEITYNYGFDENDYECYPCSCGSSKCRGYMLSDEAWRKVKRKLNGNGRRG
jgi:SET domain-containing protein